MGQSLTYRVERHALAAPFRISGYVFEASDLVVVELTDGTHRGRGEGGGVYYLGDEAPQMIEQLEASRAAIEACESREALRQILPPGGARNAVDCAMWELEASRQNVPAYKIAGFDELKPLVTTFTLGADEPEVMAQGARNYVGARAIKIKLTGSLELDVARVRSVRAARRRPAASASRAGPTLPSPPGSSDQRRPGRSGRDIVRRIGRAPARSAAGRRWHHEQKWVDRAPMTTRRIGRPQRWHGSPVRW